MPTDRTAVAARRASEEHLAPYAQRSEETRGRVHGKEPHPFRGAFQRDRDRIIHSSAFRRLEYKTQVFVNHEGDHYRTRLTHTLEVAQISRSLARALRLNEDLTEAIALAHDLGHTPFGHSGEEALNGLMIDHGGFEHNAQGLRVVDLLEERYPDFPGLNLTFEVREGFATHSTRHDFPKESKGFDPTERPTLEAQIVSVADEIAYDNHDLDDGLTSGILREEDVSKLKIWQEVDDEDGAGLPPKMRWARAIRRLIDMEVTDVVETTEARIRESGVKTVEDVRRHGEPLVNGSARLTTMKDDLEAYLASEFYSYYTVRRMANKARGFMEEMFQAYVRDPVMLPPENQRAVEEYGLQRTVADYLAGMTDRFAQQEYRRLFHPFERT
jgi:dGTPase